MPDVLWLDSSIVRRGGKDLRRLAKLAQAKGVWILVHAHIHLELCRYYRESRRARGLTFEQSFVTSMLDLLGIEVVDVTLSRATAEKWAELLDQRYPTGDEWKRAKLETVRARLGEGAAIPEERVPMTTDWLVALEIEDQKGYAAVGDKGEEWTALRTATPPRAMSYDDTMQWLESQPDPT